MEKQMIIKGGTLLIDGIFQKKDLIINHSVITEVAEQAECTNEIEVIDATDLMVLPGFIDIHTHGAAGIDISSATEKELKELTNFYVTQGTTAFLPTLLTAAPEEFNGALERVKNVIQEGTTGAKMLGIHMEGPYLCKQFKGAMPEELIVPPSIEQFEEYNRLSGNNIKLVTIAPENENSVEFIRYAKQQGIVVSIGHSGADYDQCMTCIDAGIKSATHLFNAMQPLHLHRPSVIGACLESDIFCELICDGRHLHPGIVRLAVKTKGMDRIIAVTDSIMAAGLPDGNYKLGSNDIVVIEGDAQLADGSTRAGSTLTTIQALENIVRFTGTSIEKCIEALTYNPAKLLGLEESKGSIQVSKDADLVIIDDQYNVRFTIVEGKVVYIG